jgi:hypothetical protein
LRKELGELPEVRPPKREAVASIAINMTSVCLASDRISELLTLLRTEVRLIEEAIDPLKGAIMHARLDA